MVGFVDRRWHDEGAGLEFWRSQVKSDCDNYV